MIIISNRSHLPNINLLVNPTVRLCNEVPRILEELILEFSQEEVVRHHLFRQCQLPLRRLEIELDIELPEELGHRVLVLVALKLHDLHDLLECVPDLAGSTTGASGGCGFASEDGSGGDVTQDPGAARLDRVEVSRCEEGLEKQGAALLVVKVDEERPVQEPATGVELKEGTLRGRRCAGTGSCGWCDERSGTRVNGVPEGVEFFECNRPFSTEDIRSKLSPV
jgi:hypothetical protein